MTDKNPPERDEEEYTPAELARERDRLATKKLKTVTPQPIQNPIAKVLVLGSATGLGLGLLPVAPGTWGSLLGIPFGLWLLTFTPYWAILICLAFFIPAVWVSDRAGLHYGHRDSGKIVIDEVLGQGITLLGCYHFMGQSNLSSTQIPWAAILLAFGLFRLLDIVKPFPARTMDRQANGLGVMADDVVAGLYGAILVRFILLMWFTSNSL